jgi:cytochrome c oxidase subunit 3
MPEGRTFAPQFASSRHRDETAELGMWVFIGTEILLFGGLLLGYSVYRHAYPQAFAEASRHTDILIGTVNTAILLTSSFLVACAVDALQTNGRGACIALLASTIVLGSSFLGLKAIEYADEYRAHLIPGIKFAFDGPLANGVQLFFVFYFVATAVHALHMLIGIGVLATLALLLRKSSDTRRRGPRQ